MTAKTRNPLEPHPFTRNLVLGLAAAFIGASCAEAEDQTASETGITLPEGFAATVFADDLGSVRHLAVSEDGVLYAILRRQGMGGGIVALADSDGDGIADRKQTFGNVQGTGLAVANGWLYAGSDGTVFRFKLPEEGLAPEGDPEVIVSGFPAQGQHAAKSLALDGAGNLYVNVGASSNACQRQTRTPGSEGRRPCPQLKRQASIWRFDANRTGQTQTEDGVQYVRGIRNAVALAWNAEQGALYFLQHGRDQLNALWPEYFDTQDNAELPAEEFHRAAEGAEYGWPYTYYDGLKNTRMVAPEYGGDGQLEAELGRYPEPLIAFPAHWAPNGLLFYGGGMFPPEYQGGAFIAFHGSWNRAPLPQAGYNVVFVPFDQGAPAGEWFTFADGFAGGEQRKASGNARFRPMGLAVAPDGALYIGETEQGRIWRVTYTGE